MRSTDEGSFLTDAQAATDAEHLAKKTGRSRRRSLNRGAGAAPYVPTGAAPSSLSSPRGLQIHASSKESGLYVGVPMGTCLSSVEGAQTGYSRSVAACPRSIP